MAKPDHKLLVDLRRQMRSDLKPVKPLRLEWLAVGLVGMVVFLATVVLSSQLGLRNDREALGTLLLWGPSALQILVALSVLGLAVKESLPGRSSSSGLLWASIGAGVICHVVTTLLVSQRGLPHRVDCTQVLHSLWDAGVGLCLGIPILLLTVWIARRGFTARIRRVGLLAGGGAALAADAIWRLFCPVSEPSHVFGAHGMTIGVLALVGWAVAYGWRHRAAEALGSTSTDG